MKNFKDLTGKKFWKLTAIEVCGRNKYGLCLWKCRCECGKEVVRSSATLLQNKKSGCGCERIKHGGKGTRLYKIWNMMIQRCTNANYDGWKNYGGRGISVCEDWRNSFILFRDWALENGYDEKLTIDRYPNKHGNYEASNCRWTDQFGQMSNYSGNVMLNDGEELHLFAMARKHKINPTTLHYRLKRFNNNLDMALNAPFPKRNYPVLQLDKDLNLIKMWECGVQARSFGFDSRAIYGCCNGRLKSHRGFLWKYA